LVHGLDTQVDISILNLQGASLQKNSYLVDASREVALDISDVPVGTYLIKVQGNSVDQQIKIAKT
jgi:hypothetical protein